MIGKTISHYQITSQLGEGGKGGTDGVDAGHWRHGGADHVKDLLERLPVGDVARIGDNLHAARDEIPDHRLRFR